jgi:hypothetical protein
MQICRRPAQAWVEQIRADIAQRKVAEEITRKAQSPYPEWEQTLASMDEANPFQLSAAGRKFFDKLRETIKPAFEGGQSASPAKG